MKKFLIFFSFLFAINIANAQTTNISVAQSVYKYCEREIPEIKAINSIKSNIEDVKNERKLRQCLNTNIFNLY